MRARSEDGCDFVNHIGTVLEAAVENAQELSLLALCAEL